MTHLENPVVLVETVEVVQVVLQEQTLELLELQILVVEVVLVQYNNHLVVVWQVEQEGLVL